MQQEMQRKNRKLFRLPLRVYLTYLMLLTLIFTAASFSKFAVSDGSGDTAGVAALAVDGSIEPDQTFTAVFNSTSPGYSGDSYVQETYDIVVRNHTEAAASEVALRYDIVITASQTLSDGIIISAEGKNAVRNGNIYTISDVGEFAPGERNGEHTVKLTVKADPSKITERYSDVELEITVVFEQID